MKEFGLVTIIQAPRVDLTPKIKMILGDGFNIYKKGALDGLTLEEVKKYILWEAMKF